MRKINLILLFNWMFIPFLIGETLVQNIKNIYNKLDSALYTNNVILSYKEHELEMIEETERFVLKMNYPEDSVLVKNKLDDIMECYRRVMQSPLFDERLLDERRRERRLLEEGRAMANVYLNIKDSILRNFVMDSLTIAHSTNSLKENYTQLIYQLETLPVHFVLNLEIDTCSLSDIGLIQLLPDMGPLPFNLFCFTKNYKGGLYIYCKNGTYSWQDSGYRTFSRQLGKNAPKVFRRIMRKRPDYLLYCSQLEGMNTILYMKNECIYVYRIIEMEEYELNEYLEKFKDRIVET